MSADLAPPLPRRGPAEVVGSLLGPVPTAVLVLAPTLRLLGFPQPDEAVAAFLGTALGVVFAVRAVAGPGPFTLRPLVPLLLVAETLCLGVLYWTGAPGPVVAGFVAFAVFAAVALLAPRLRLWGHGVVAGALAGSGAVWLPPPLWPVAPVLLAALVWSQAASRSRTWGAAVLGSAVGLVLGQAIWVVLLLLVMTL